MVALQYFKILASHNERYRLAYEFDCEQLITVHCSLFTVHCSLIIVYCSTHTETEPPLQRNSAQPHSLVTMEPLTCSVKS